MRFRFEATPEEIRDKKELLVKALSQEFQPIDSEIADAFEKALPHKEPSLKFKVLEDIRKRTSDTYQKLLDKMVADIGKVLDGKTVLGSDLAALAKSISIIKAQNKEEALKKVDTEVKEDDPDNDPDYDAEGEPIYDPKTGLTPSETAEEKEKHPEDFEDEGEDIEKSGPYIGPRGGRWADPKHTIPWKASDDKIKSLQKLVQKLGGKLREHKTDPNKIMLKVPKEYTKELMQMKQKLGLPDKIEVGQKYVMVPIPLKSSVVQKMEDKPKPEPKQTETGKHKDPEYTKSIPYKEPKTVKDAEDWCKLQGITANFPDLPTAKVVTEAISRSHPMVAKHVQFIGTSSQLKAWAKANPDKAKVAKEQAKHKMDLMKQSPLKGGSAIAIAHPTTPKPYTESVIVVKDSYWNEFKANDFPGKQGSFSVSGNLGGTVTHELGHVEGFVLRHLYPEKSGQSAWEVWKSHCIPMLKKNRKQLMKDISHYGATNPHEAWAELSVLRRRGIKPAKWIQEAITAMGIDKTWWSDMAK